MAATVTDQDVKEIQNVTRNVVENPEKYEDILNGDKPLEVDGKYYTVVNSANNDTSRIDGVTQALAVVPCDQNNENQDYSQTIMTVGGTQADLSKLNVNGSSFNNAIDAKEHLTNQTPGVDQFYVDTMARVSQHEGGKISVISGHSQAGPAVAKIGAKYHVDKIVNFQPWGGEAAVDSGGINPDDKKYLDEHCTVYTDQGKSITKLDGNGGNPGYGRVYTVGGSSHAITHFHLKGNGLDTDWYVAKGEFCSGMTKEQAEKVARAKARKDVEKIKKRYAGFDYKEFEQQKYKEYLGDYEHEYGPYADSKKSSKTGKVKQTSFAFTKDKSYSLAELDKFIGQYKAQLLGGTALGSQQILVKAELLIAVAHQALEHFALYEAKALSDLEDIKEEVRRDCQEAIDICFQAAQNLPAGEVEALIEPIRFENVWDQSAEADFRAQLQRYKGQMEDVSSHLITSAQNFTTTDNAGAAMFTLT